ncbi:hypothetical protein CW304_26135 [Bacillus sp. UFRGS-B20]|nr:hypothetical protein CW304_26135 [Bacillus sp. UFRGS-B20]
MYSSLASLVVYRFFIACPPSLHELISCYIMASTLFFIDRSAPNGGFSFSPKNDLELLVTSGSFVVIFSFDFFSVDSLI